MKFGKILTLLAASTLAVGAIAAPAAKPAKPAIHKAAVTKTVKTPASKTTHVKGYTYTRNGKTVTVKPHERKAAEKHAKTAVKKTDKHAKTSAKTAEKHAKKMAKHAKKK